MSENLDKSKVKEIETSSIELLKRADLMEIKTQSDYECAAVELQEIDRLQKKIETFFKPHVERAYAVWNGLTKSRKAHLDPLDNIKKIISGKMSIYTQAQRALEAEKQRKAEEAAKKEEEAKRKIKEEQERKWREKEEEARKEAERLAEEGKEQEAQKALDLAEKAAAKAEERAEEKESIQVVPVIVPAQVQKVKGVRTTDVWNYEVIDFSKIPDSFKIVDDAKIKRTVSALHEDVCTVIPGIRAVKTTKISVTGKLK